MKHATVGAPYRVPPEPSRWSAIFLAVAVHALLLSFLYVGINWQNTRPVAVEAEVWDFKTQAAAPPAPPPQEVEQPEPEPTPPPKVVEQPVEQPVAPPDISLEREKKRKDELRRQQQARELAEKKREEARLKDLAEKKAAADKLKAEKLAKAKADAAERAKKDDLRKQEMQRMMGVVGSGSSGTAEKSTAPRRDDGYVAAITTVIKSNTRYAGSTDMPGNPKVSFRVEQLPTGEIMSVKLIKSSGLPAFDDAVEKGIKKSSPLPKKKDGTVERSLVVDFSMKDLN